MPKSLLTAAVFSTLVLSVATPSACTAAQDKIPDARPAGAPPPRSPTRWRASCAWSAGEWKMTAAAGTELAAEQAS